MGNGSALTLNFLRYAKNIFNFGIINDNKAIGLLKKYRAEINSAKNNNNNVVNGNNQLFTGDESGKLVELEKKLIENHLDKMR